MSQISTYTTNLRSRMNQMVHYFMLVNIKVSKSCKKKNTTELRRRTFDVSFPAIAIRTWPPPPHSSSALHCRQSPQGQYHAQIRESQFTTGSTVKQPSYNTNYSIPATSPHLEVTNGCLSVKLPTKQM